MAKRDEFTPHQKEKILQKKFDNRKTFIDPAGRVTSRKNAEVDHIVPTSKGGKATFKNAQVINRLTNQEKGDQLSGTIGPKTNEYTFNVNKNAKIPKMNVKKK